jgi:hypothetical protein
MGRQKGAITTPETNSIANEIEQLLGTKRKYNIDTLRLLELLLSYRVAENICSYDKDTPINEIPSSVEIPFIGTVNIKPSVFHEKHRLTDEPSIHLEFSFTPNNGFKSDILRAYRNKDCELAELFSKLYSDRLNEVYERMQREE